MPYIKAEDRPQFQVIIDQLPAIQSPGELNFVLTKVVHAYIKSGTANYQRYNDAIGALEGAKLELYRRAVAPYEDEKITLNGDV